MSFVYRILRRKLLAILWHVIIVEHEKSKDACVSTMREVAYTIIDTVLTVLTVQGRKKYGKKLFIEIHAEKPNEFVLRRKTIQSCSLTRPTSTSRAAP